MNIKFREIEEKNTAGLTVIYLQKNSDTKNIFEEDRILWVPNPKGLELAQKSPISIEDKKLVMVDSDHNMLGFYLLGPEEGSIVCSSPFTVLTLMIPHHRHPSAVVPKAPAPCSIKRAWIFTYAISKSFSFRLGLQ